MEHDIHMRNRHDRRALQRALGLDENDQGQVMKRISDYPDWSDQPVLYEDDYFYTVPFGNLAPGITSATQTIVIQAESKFEWLKSSVYGNLHGATAPFQTTDQIETTIFITDSGSGRQLMSVPVPVMSIAGDGQLPNILPVGRIFQPNATISAVMANFSTANTWDNLYFTFIGRKIFKSRG